MAYPDTMLHHIAEPCREGYIKGATEQQDVDIENACNWLENFLLRDNPLKRFLLDELRKTMKGE